jgi:hypothetical protein
MRVGNDFQVKVPAFDPGKTSEGPRSVKKSKMGSPIHTDFTLYE